jgi:hypothetical protein
MDYAGPFEVAIGRRREKRWIVVFTCLAMRAIHLEVASSLDTSSCILCIRNFMNRRGTPLEIISDNGTNLRGAEKELKLLLKELDIKRIASETQPMQPGLHNIKWRFITPTASHFGGIWERMVRCVKSSLYHVLKCKAPPDELFRSAIIEVESTVNSRPLYYTSTEDVGQPSITPNSLLQLQLNNAPLPQNPQNISSRKQWVVVQRIAHEFWIKWLHQYLPTIATRSKWFDDSKPLEIGTLVLLVDDSVKRGEWRRGIVINVHKSPDGKIRSATVRTAKGTFLRPVIKLAIINCNNEV